MEIAFPVLFVLLDVDEDNFLVLISVGFPSLSTAFHQCSSIELILSSWQGIIRLLSAFINILGIECCDSIFTPGSFTSTPFNFTSYCKGNLTIKHNTQILARGIQSILDKYNTAEGCIPCKGNSKRKL